MNLVTDSGKSVYFIQSDTTETTNDLTSVLRNSSHFPSLDGFRAISVIMVIFSHLFETIHTTNPWLRFFSGTLGVTFFFTISGFLITTLLLKEQEKNGHISLKKFYIRRMLRIFPVMYLFLLVLILLNAVFRLHITGFSFLTASLYIKNLFDGSDFQTGHFWTLSVEEQFYLFFPFLLRRSLKVYTWTAVVLIIVIPPFRYLNLHHISVFRFEAVHMAMHLIDSLSPILIGSLTAILIFKNKINLRFKYADSLWINLLLFVTAGLICGDFFRVIIPTNFSGTLASFPIVLIIAFNIQQRNNLWFKVMNTRAFIQIGILSYSIYIWQQLFTYDRPWSKSFLLADSVWLNLFVLLIVSYASYYLYEKQFLKLKNRFQ